VTPARRAPFTFARPKECLTPEHFPRPPKEGLMAKSKKSKKNKKSKKKGK
jgi:hypothetical protein